MPPRPSSARRTTRFSSREPEQAPSHSPNGLVRPQLPQLQGTPSSRRQYTYGSGVEPPPRVGAGLQRMDLTNAVNHALSRPDEADGFVRPLKPLPATATDADEDEVSRDGAARPAKNAAGASNPSRQTVASSDADSLRSFGMESDYYEDATIGSAPTSTPAPPRRQLVSKSNPRPLQSAPEEPVSQPLLRNSRHSNIIQPGQARVDPQVEAGQGRRVQRQTRHELDEEEQEEDEPTRRDKALAHSKKTNTPAPDRTRQTRSRPARPQKASELEEPQDEEHLDDQDSDIEQDAAGNGHVARVSGSQPLPSGSGRPPQGEGFFPRRRTGQNGAGSRGLFAQADEINRRVTSLDKVNEIPDDPRERDLAIQREIREAEDQLARVRAEQEARNRRATQRETLQQRMMQQLARFLSHWPFNRIQELWRNRRANRLDDFDEEEDEHDGPVNWWRLLHPMTYLQALVWLFDKMIDSAIGFIHKLSGIRISDRVGSAMRWIMMGVFALIIGGIALTAALSAASTASTPSFPDMGPMSPRNIHWPNPFEPLSKIGDYIPSLSWPSWGSDSDDVTDIWDADYEQREQAESSLKKELAAMKKAGKVHDLAINKLKALLPMSVHMKLDQKGRFIISQDFWHALRDLMKEDGSFFTFDKKNNDYEVTSDQQWRAIVGRLKKDQTFTPQLNASAAGIDDRIEDQLRGYWDAWVKNNEDKIGRVLSTALDKKQTAGSSQELDKRLTKIVNEQLKGQNQAVLSREDFLRHLKHEFATHGSEILAELSEIQPQSVNQVRELIRTAMDNAPEGVTKKELKSLVQGLVHNAIADMNLKAMAKGKIHVHWDTVLKNQVNFFGIGAGATIDVSRTDPAWDPWEKGVATEIAFQKGIIGVQPLPPLAALHPWQDEGDCWCAARSKNRRRNPHGASLSIQLGQLVIPQQIVVEHILPGATTDPDARPRDIEVWARIEDDATRKRIESTEGLQFLRDDYNEFDHTKPEYGEAFMQIGQFQYESNTLTDGVHVHKLSPKLQEVGVATDQIILRAVSNYGPANHTHTCFYRVRMFGEIADEIPVLEVPSMWPRED
ncbi:hypothetical protein FZEAL_5064 [Fusarium zealandicum]|uniref:SUN domain-containing protein n=1 Tax=Fusarium zealandicum TaxID=1053134 RepID=A0A8H4ULH8_9HYPO|nr:hypothetical protein FZEAL_5064 [Fusarium zealandicum]